MAALKRSSKGTRSSLALMAAVGVLIGVLIGGGGFGSAASGTDASVVDYSQCANGKPGTTPSTVCNGGWINGILNANNSQYSENQVTAQRLVLALPAGKQNGRTITLKYLWNKSVHHAYDSLAKWNTTITGLDTAAKVCAGVPGGPNGCPATSSNFNGGDGDSQFEVPSSSCSSGHELSNRDLVMFGGTITGVTAPANDSGTCSTGADEYETITITYDALSAGATRVMLLFGGHLAAGLGGTGWGAGLGSHDINGGPYHIKLTSVDSSAIGNRDNQISAGAILAQSPSIGTQPSNTGHLTFSEDLNDSVTLGGGATGNVHFYLFDNSTDCNAAGDTPTGSSTGLLYSQTVAAVAGSAQTDGTGTGSNNVTASGDYYWTVIYDGDGSLNLAASSVCAEHSSFTAPTLPTVTNTAG